MPIPAEVIQFPLRQGRQGEGDSFSVGDETLVRRLLCVLTDEMIAGDLSYEARARLYFYLSLHGRAIQRWVCILSVTYELQNEYLSEQLNYAFQRATSLSTLEEAQDDKVYFDKVATLSSNLHSLLQLIRSQ
jgi:hypothetical protein